MSFDLLAKMKSKLLQRKEESAHSSSLPNQQVQAQESKNEPSPPVLDHPHNQSVQLEKPKIVEVQAQPLHSENVPSKETSLMASKLLLLKELKVKKEGSIAKIPAQVKEKEEQRSELKGDINLESKQKEEEQPIVFQIKEDKKEEEKEPEEVEEKQVEAEAEKSEKESNQKMKEEKSMEFIQGEEKVSQQKVPDEREKNDFRQMGQAIESEEPKKPLELPEQQKFMHQQNFQESLSFKPASAEVFQEQNHEDIKKSEVVQSISSENPIKRTEMTEKEQGPSESKQTKMNLLMEKMRMLMQMKKQESRPKPSELIQAHQINPSAGQHEKKNENEILPSQQPGQQNQPMQQQQKMQAQAKPLKIYTKQKKIFLKEKENIRKQVQNMKKILGLSQSKRDDRPEAKDLVQLILQLQQMVNTLIPN